MKKSKTQRGFTECEFKDRGGVECSIQKSSLATEDAIWFGAKEIGLQHFKAHEGWKEIKLTDTIEEHYIANNRMHLTKKQIKKLLPILQKFVETGEL